MTDETDETTRVDIAHAWDYGRDGMAAIRRCTRCGASDAYWDDEEYLPDPCPAARIDLIGKVAREYHATPWQLADMADCATPDSDTSDGAQMLARVAEDIASLIVDMADDLADVDVTEWPDTLDYAGAVHGITDAAPDIYTSGKWRQFVDLAAWQEDPVGEYGPDVAKDLDQLASIALYMIAERCAWAVVAEIGETFAAAWEDIENGEGVD